MGLGCPPGGARGRSRPAELGSAQASAHGLVGFGVGLGLGPALADLQVERPRSDGTDVVDKYGHPLLPLPQVVQLAAQLEAHPRHEGGRAHARLRRLEVQVLRAASECTTPRRQGRRGGSADVATNRCTSEVISDGLLMKAWIASPAVTKEFAVDANDASQ